MFKRKHIFIGLLPLALEGGFTATTFADFTVETGETYTLSVGETLTIDGNLTIAATGTVDASAANTNISLSGNWTNSGTFTSGISNTVTFTDNTLTSTITGSNSFYNFTCTTASKNLTFEAGSAQTIASILTLNGQASGTEIQLRSSAAGTRWTFDVTGGSQSVDYVDVKDSQSSTNDITADNSTNSGNNDDTDGLYFNYGDPSTITWPGAGTPKLFIGTNGNVGIGTATPDAELEVNGYTKLGSDAPKIKMKKITGTTNSSEGVNKFTAINPGMTGSILSVDCLIEFQTGSYMPPETTLGPGYRAHMTIHSGVVRVWNAEADSGNILSKPFTCLITYEE